MRLQLTPDGLCSVFCVSCLHQALDVHLCTLSLQRSWFLLHLDPKMLRGSGLATRVSSLDLNLWKPSFRGGRLLLLLFRAQKDHQYEVQMWRENRGISGMFCVDEWCKGLWDLTVGVVLAGSSGRELKSANSFASCKKIVFLSLRKHPRYYVKVD